MIIVTYIIIKDGRKDSDGDGRQERSLEVIENSLCLISRNY